MAQSQSTWKAGSLFCSNPGDSIYFDSSMGHLYASAGEKDARILVVCVAT
jgi:uncharacterized membrane protein